jgi:3-oxoacyl-[acyl-carrier protein] reductase
VQLGLEDKVALVTGSYRGTGSAIAEGLAREGATVLVHGFQAGQPDAVVDRLKAANLRAHGIVGDLLHDSGAQDACDQARKLAGRIDILVNNYGVAEGGSWTKSTTADWVDLYQKNVLSGVRMVNLLAEDMRAASWGRIIWLGTVGSMRPAARMPHYYASKAVLPNLCVSLAKELAQTGITVNVVSPGIIATEEIKAHVLRRARKQGWGDDWATIQRQALGEMFDNPTGRFAEVDEVASLVSFLASERAGYINGANLRIDGGASDCAV